MMNIFTNSIRLTCLLSALFLSAGCGSNGDDDNSTNFRFVNAVAGVDSIDLLVDLEIFLEDVAYLESSGYFDFDTEPHIFQITPSNSLTPIDETKTTLSDDVDYTYLAFGTSADAEAMLLKDDNSPPGGGTFKIRTVNVVPAPRPLDVYIVSEPSDIGTVAPTEESISYKQASTYRIGGAGAYVVVVTERKTGRVLATTDPRTFDSEAVYTMVLSYERGDDEGLAVTILRDR